ncbi:Transmembrane protein 106A [Heterocephalus glaber]|uniref:Transmembrane protein 106A n=1 Tax=Heterocephalus glaber TaxID=10181 RepID=G5B4X6_HETGA|nr:Transmembrane protein 106A [Heterocephalus glaber]
MGKTLSQPGSPGGAERSALLSTRPAGSRFVPCPTCRGSREIPRELEEQLVALIPYGDQRLEPRHTAPPPNRGHTHGHGPFLQCVAEYLRRTVLPRRRCPGLAVPGRELWPWLQGVWAGGFPSASLLLIVVQEALRVPGSARVPGHHGLHRAVRPAGLSSSSVAFDKGTVHLKATSVLNISNPNYCPVTVTRLTVQALHVSLMVGQLSEMLYAVATRISDETTYKICTWLEIKVHYVVLHIQGTLTYSYLGREDQHSFEGSEGTLTYSYLGREDQHSFEGSEYVDCRRGSALAPHPP